MRACSDTGEAAMGRVAFVIAQLTYALACGAAGQFIARTLSYEARAIPCCRSSCWSFELESIVRCVGRTWHDL